MCKILLAEDEVALRPILPAYRQTNSIGGNMSKSIFSSQVTPDGEGLVSCIRREGTPKRVHLMELFLDDEIQQKIIKRYNITDGLDPDDPYFGERTQIALQSFLGYDFVTSRVEGLDFELCGSTTKDTSDSGRGERWYVNEQKGPITSWEEFEAYPWPDPEKISTRGLEWYQENLPDNMCIIGWPGGHFAEHLSFLMGYESFCYALFDQRDLVEAMAKRLFDMYEKACRRVLEFSRVKLVWGTDDMGFRTGTLISPDDLREFVFPGHKRLASLSHEAGRPYMIHSCGKLDEVMDDLIDDVAVDAKHSFEDTIEQVTDAKSKYGDRIAVLGGIDVDFLCRVSEEEIRERVRHTLEICMPGGGYCLGSGNSVANYIPVDNYLAMVDEAHKFKV